MKTDAEFDLVTLGRSSIDLYANEIGVPFPEIASFGAFVGGCPTNIAVGAQRLGLSTALVTAVGADPVGEFLLRFLRNEGVNTAFIPTKPDNRTSAVLLGIQPPDNFPLVFYRDGCADIQLSIDDVLAAPIERARAVLVTGTGLSREPSSSATRVAIESARRAGAKTLLDLDIRLDQWHDARAYGAVMRSVLANVDVVIGTEEEVIMAASAGTATIEGSQVSAPSVQGNLSDALSTLRDLGPDAIVLKHGQEGSSVHLKGGDVIEAAPFSVEVVNVLGAGDAFAAGFIHGLLEGRDWQRCARMGNALGAMVVTRHGCANFMPRLDEALEFVQERGGFEC